MAHEHENRFYHYAKKYLREEFFPETGGLTDEELKALIDKGLRAAHKYHFSTEADAMAFIDIDFRLEGALSAEEIPQWAREIIENPELTTEHKIFMLRDAYCTIEWIGNA